MITTDIYFYQLISPKLHHSRLFRLHYNNYSDMLLTCERLCCFVLVCYHRKWNVCLNRVHSAPSDGIFAEASNDAQVLESTFFAMFYKVIIIIFKKIKIYLECLFHPSFLPSLTSSLFVPLLKMGVRSSDDLYIQQRI